MADFQHIDNLIQGEVLRIQERRAPEARQDDFESLLDFLYEQKRKVLMAKLKDAEAQST